MCSASPQMLEKFDAEASMCECSIEMLFFFKKFTSSWKGSHKSYESQVLFSLSVSDDFSITLLYCQSLCWINCWVWIEVHLLYLAKERNHLGITADVPNYAKEAGGESQNIKSRTAVFKDKLICNSKFVMYTFHAINCVLVLSQQSQAMCAVQMFLFSHFRYPKIFQPVYIFKGWQ